MQALSGKAILGAGIICGASVILLADASLKNKKAEYKFENLTRLQLITALYLEENKHLNWRLSTMEENKKVGAFSKVHNSTKILGGVGIALIGIAALKGCIWDQQIGIAAPDPALPEPDLSFIDNIVEGAGAAVDAIPGVDN